jgi:hypothetical protein
MTKNCITNRTFIFQVLNLLFLKCSEPFAEKMARLKAQLLGQFEKGNELKERIKMNFERL